VGQLEITPASNEHGLFQALIVQWLADSRNGKVCFFDWRRELVRSGLYPQVPEQNRNRLCLSLQVLGYPATTRNNT